MIPKALSLCDPRISSTHRTGGRFAEFDQLFKKTANISLFPLWSTSIVNCSESTILTVRAKAYYNPCGSLNEKGAVAPHAGAWIETSANAKGVPNQSVAPHAGAWIETGYGA